MRHSGEPVRPRTLSVALALTGISGLGNVLVGAVVLLLLHTGALPNTGGAARSTLLSIGLSYLLLGALTMVGGYGLWVHRPGSRAFVTIVMMLRIATACVTFGVLGNAYSAASAVGIVVAVVVIALLWDSHANEYFHQAG